MVNADGGETVTEMFTNTFSIHKYLTDMLFDGTELTHIVGKSTISRRYFHSFFESSLYDFQHKSCSTFVNITM